MLTSIWPRSVSWPLKAKWTGKNRPKNIIHPTASNTTLPTYHKQVINPNDLIMIWVQRALPQDVGGAQPAGQCQDGNASITGRSGQAMAGSSVTGDNVPPHI